MPKPSRKERKSRNSLGDLARPSREPKPVRPARPSAEPSSEPYTSPRPKKERPSSTAKQVVDRDSDPEATHKANIPTRSNTALYGVGAIVAVVAVLWAVSYFSDKTRSSAATAASVTPVTIPFMPAGSGRVLAPPPAETGVMPAQEPTPALPAKASSAPNASATAMQKTPAATAVPTATARAVAASAQPVVAKPPAKPKPTPEDIY